MGNGTPCFQTQDPSSEVLTVIWEAMQRQRIKNKTINRMIDIKKRVKTPSRALEYMRDGILRQQKRKKVFRIDMGTFGTWNESLEICIGCAATCTIQQIAKKDFTKAFDGKIVQARERRLFLGFEPSQFYKFEFIMNEARSGKYRALFYFFGKGRVWRKIRWMVSDELQVCLINDTVRTKGWIKKLNKTIAFFKEHGC